VWDTDTGKKVFTLSELGLVNHMAYSPDGRRLVVVGTADPFEPLLGPAAAFPGPGRRQVRMWDADTGRELLTVPTRLDNTRSLAFRPDGHTLLVAGTDKGWPAVEVLDG